MGIRKVLKGDLIRRSKKAFQLTPSERKSLGKVKIQIKKTPEKIKKLGSRIDFGNLFGTPLRKLSPIKKRKKKRKTQQYIIVKIKK